jgi:hypothetical protein
MKIKYSPQINDQHEVSYSFNGDVITVTVNNETDTFDFSSMPNDSVAQRIISSLPIIVIPIVSKDENGELWVTLFKPITSNATEAECFPDWKDV